MLFILLYLVLWSFSLYECVYNRLIVATTMKDMFIGLNPIVAFMVCLPYFQLCLVHSWRLLEICRTLCVDGMAMLECKINCYLSLLVLRSSRLYDINYLRFRRVCKIRKCSYPTPDSCGRGRASKGNLGFHSILDF